MVTWDPPNRKVGKIIDTKMPADMGIWDSSMEDKCISFFLTLLVHVFLHGFSYTWFRTQDSFLCEVKDRSNEWRNVSMIDLQFCHEELPNHNQNITGNIHKDERTPHPLRKNNVHYFAPLPFSTWSFHRSFTRQNIDTKGLEWIFGMLT